MSVRISRLKRIIVKNLVHKDITLKKNEHIKREKMYARDTHTHTHTHTHTREMLRIVVNFLYYNNNFLHFSLTEETTTFSRFPLSNTMYVLHK